ncbi:Headcase protein [Dirofilaria immitis]
MWNGKRTSRFRTGYLHAICITCMHTEWKCPGCGNSGWFLGSALIVGTLYTYDVLSSTTCCIPVCRHCQFPSSNGMFGILGLIVNLAPIIFRRKIFDFVRLSEIFILRVKSVKEMVYEIIVDWRSGENRLS